MFNPLTRYALVAVAMLAGAAATRTVVATVGTDVTTYHNDNARTGQNLTETALSSANVRSSAFGKIALVPLDGKVDAQPLYLSGLNVPALGARDILYAATEHGTVYAIDAASLTAVWAKSMLGPGELPSEAVGGCGQVTPEIGITATPVIDRANNVIYVVAMSRNGSTYFQRLHALDLTTGAEMFGGPRTITAAFPKNGGSVTFDPRLYEERSGLTLTNGKLILAFTSHCDQGAYTGWVMAYDPFTLAQTSVLNVTPNGSMGGIWMAGAGPAADTAGNIYVLDGNGTFDTTLNGNGFPINGNFGNAFLKISTTGALAVADYFAMFDTVSKSNADTDLGSGGTLLLPNMLDSGGVTRRLAVGAGKDAHIYVVNRDAMGKFNPSANLIYQDITGAIGGVWSMPAYFNNTLYYGASGDNLKAFPIANARVATTSSSRSVRSFTYPGTTPSISASGTSNGIVWAVENTNPAVLHAYDATNLATEIYNSSQAGNSRDSFGAGNKFITPTIANGRVYVGTQTGLAVFGPLAPAAPTNVRIVV
jgi:outer membrane protein assembly factor BamB